ncbi:hypothetical protein [Seohaeicola zhoushanensis]|uniref:Uncharacterized protein n=1 Tax=Seohaeicola zhoushanensis TaxID=1569283 RepID=A0A8J3H2P0_9RHOB|nr:hypothetical protein [Seohaeicola zhoushanensis]GHF70010.1 hypothetical protein GCM10017056_46330 [Seohaeicola zhoushanensis]
MIVCLGWGSLIWNPGDLPIKGGWQADGPVLPLEFARQSGERHITLVVCESGTPCTCLWAELDVPDVEAARSALKTRERLPSTRNAAYWSPGDRSDHFGGEIIEAWAIGRKLDGVVWTGLPPKSPATEKNHDFPSADVVLEHLKALDGEARVKAEEYVRRAPPKVRTPYRTRIEAELDWLPQD